MARSQRERKWRLLSDAAGAAARRGPGDTRHNHVDIYMYIGYDNI